MLPENQKQLEYYVRKVKEGLDDLLSNVGYMREGYKASYASGRGELYFLSDVMLYLADLLTSDEAGRVAESFNEWVNRKYEEYRQLRQSGIFSK